MLRTRVTVVLLAAMVVAGAACKKNPPVARPTPPPPNSPFPGAVPPAKRADARPGAALSFEPPVIADPLNTSAIDDQQELPLKPVFFALDSDELDGPARATLSEDAQVLKRYPQGGDVEGY